MSYGLASCPRCRGAGVILTDVALECGCARQASRERLDLPRRLAPATLDSFKGWWQARTTGKMSEAAIQGDLLALKELGKVEPNDRVIQGLLEGCEESDQTTSAWLPEGYRAFLGWVAAGRLPNNFLWILGESGTGRSSLAVSAMKAWGRFDHPAPCFEEACTLGDRIESWFYNPGRDEGDDQALLGRLRACEVLVLDNFQDFAGDVRVGRKLDALLRSRHAQDLATILIAPSLPVDSFERWVGHPFARPEYRRSALVQTLMAAPRVEMVPAIEQLLRETVR